MSPGGKPPWIVARSPPEARSPDTNWISFSPTSRPHPVHPMLLRGADRQDRMASETCSWALPRQPEVPGHGTRGYSSTSSSASHHPERCPGDRQHLLLPSGGTTFPREPVGTGAPVTRPTRHKRRATPGTHPPGSSSSPAPPLLTYGGPAGKTPPSLAKVGTGGEGSTHEPVAKTAEGGRRGRHLGCPPQRHRERALACLAPRSAENRKGTCLSSTCSPASAGTT